MSTYTWAVRPSGLVSHHGPGTMEGLLEVLRGACRVVAFAYRLRTGHAVRSAAAPMR